MKSVVITGATGAIGRALIKVVIDAGYEVLAVIHRSSHRAAELETIEHCRVLRLNINEYNHAIGEMKKQHISLTNYEIFFHLAWMAPFGKDRENLELQLENVKASLDTVRFAKALGCSCFIGTGSQAEYGRVEGILSQDTLTNPETGYGIAKLCASQMTRLACEHLGMRHIWCRVLSVYGPYDRDETLISTAIRKMLNNEETEFSPCDQVWDYIYAEDAAQAILLSAQKGNHGGIYIVGSGEARPLKEYIQDIARLTGYTREIGFGRRPYNEKQVMFLQADINALKALGFHPEYSFEQGIEQTISFFKRTN
ncbi:MAG: NAD(P)-dependent oxidoreductase [Flexilinea sp.]|nr:NAD(P)-dependent oxidoreductase [Flexilinea sp.]